MKILQIVPKLPPAICGVGDYASLLGKQMAHDLGVQSSYLALGHEVCASVDVPQLIFDAAHHVDAVLVHYSCYGYQKNGLPFSLVAALERLAEGGNILVTMFHELAATGPITSKAFWLGRFQKGLVTRLAKVSSAIRTNRVAYKAQLEELAPQHRDRVIAMPVFSNFGESVDPLPLAERQRKLVMFQPPAYEKGSSFWKAWSRLCERLGPTETIVAGRAKTVPAEVTQMGIVSTEEAISLLTENMWGLVDYYPGYLGKSGIFAAHAAHGIAVFTARGLQGEDEGLRAGTHYLVDGMRETDLQPVVDRLHTWYMGHSQGVSAASFAGQMVEAEPVLVTR
jgi:hypothetical protein